MIDSVELVLLNNFKSRKYNSFFVYGLSFNKACIDKSFDKMLLIYKCRCRKCNSFYELVPGFYRAYMVFKAGNVTASLFKVQASTKLT